MEKEEPKHVGTHASCCISLPGRHQTQVNEKEPSVSDLGEKATPACPAIGAATLTPGIHLRPPGWKQRAPEENGFLLEPGSVPGWCGKEG